MLKQRYVLIKNIVCRWEDKEPFVPSGVSVFGAIEYYKEEDKLRCHECGKWYSHLGAHIHNVHGSARNYKIKHGLLLNTPLYGMIARANHQSPLAKHTNLNSIATNLHSTASRAKAKASVTATIALRRFTNGNLHMESRNLKGKCQAQLLKKLQNIKTELGHDPYAAEMINLDTELFGGVINMREMAGMKRQSFRGRPGVLRGSSPRKGISNLKARKWDSSSLIEMLRDFKAENHRLPNRLDWRSGLLPSQHTYKLHFGGLKNAYLKAGLYKVAQEQKVA